MSFDDEMQSGYAETMELVRKYGLKYSDARSIVDGTFVRDNPQNGGSTIQDWVHKLPRMQQAVLLTSIRNEDGRAKRHPAKLLIKWFRRCVLITAFEGNALTTMHEPGGGSFTGPAPDNMSEKDVVDAFIDSRDEMLLHYYAHAMHSFQILGYKHPDTKIRAFWLDVYTRMVHCLHVWPETEEQMDRRLGGTMQGWQERNDPSSTCSD